MKAFSSALVVLHNMTRINLTFGLFAPTVRTNALRGTGIFVIVALLLWNSNSHGIVLTIKDNLTDDMFGVAPKGTVDATPNMSSSRRQISGSPIFPIILDS